MESISILEIAISIAAISGFYYLGGWILYKVWRMVEEPPKPKRWDNDKPWRGKQDLRGLTQIEKQRWN